MKATEIFEITPTRHGKRCPSCQEIKPLEDFARSRNKTSGRASYCKPCKKARYGEKETIRSRERRRRNPEASRAYARMYHQRRKNRVGVSEQIKTTQRKAWFRNRYGMTVEEVEKMRQQQDGKCLICKDSATHIDHCHVTGTIRGILCAQCNHGLGHFRDNIDFLRAAIEYLERSVRL